MKSPFTPMRRRRRRTGDAPFRTRRFGGIKMLRRRRKARAAEKLMRQGNVSHLICDTWKSMEHVNPSDGVRVIVLAHGSEFPVRPSANKKRRISESLRKVHRILTSSAAARERMRQGGFDTTKAEVFHPPIGEPSPVAESASVWAANHWQDRGPRILSVGRLVRRKGIDKAIRAVAGLAPRHPRLRYLIAGDGEETPALRRPRRRIGHGGAHPFLRPSGQPAKGRLVRLRASISAAGRRRRR